MGLYFCMRREVINAIHILILMIHIDSVIYYFNRCCFKAAPKPNADIGLNNIGLTFRNAFVMPPLCHKLLLWLRQKSNNTSSSTPSNHC